MQVPTSFSVLAEGALRGLEFASSAAAVEVTLASNMLGGSQRRTRLGYSAGEMAAGESDWLVWQSTGWARGQARQLRGASRLGASHQRYAPVRALGRPAS